MFFFKSLPRIQSQTVIYLFIYWPYKIEQFSITNVLMLDLQYVEILDFFKIWGMRRILLFFYKNFFSNPFNEKYY